MVQSVSVIVLVVRSWSPPRLRLRRPTELPLMVQSVSVAVDPKSFENPAPLPRAVLSSIVQSVHVTVPYSLKIPPPKFEAELPLMCSR